jgi:hypothetical protein
VIEIDYSFNEINQQIDTIQLVDGGKILAYSLPDAEINCAINFRILEEPIPVCLLIH